MTLKNLGGFSCLIDALRKGCRKILFSVLIMLSDHQYLCECFVLGAGTLLPGRCGPRGQCPVLLGRREDVTQPRGGGDHLRITKHICDLIMTSREIYTWLPESPVLPSWPTRPRAPLTDNWFSLSLSWRFVSLIIPSLFPPCIILYLFPVLLGEGIKPKNLLDMQINVLE